MRLVIVRDGVHGAATPPVLVVSAQRRIEVMALARIGGVILGCAAAFAAAVAAMCSNGRPMRPFPPEFAPVTGISPARVILAAHIYGLVTLALWLAACAFIAGLLVGAVVQRRGERWALVAVAAFLGVLAATGAPLLPDAVYLPIILTGAALVLSAAASGGWIGEHIWRGGLRGPAPSAPDTQR